MENGLEESKLGERDNLIEVEIRKLNSGRGKSSWMYVLSVQAIFTYCLDDISCTATILDKIAPCEPPYRN